MILPIPEFFITFSVSYNCVIVIVTDIMPSLHFVKYMTLIYDIILYLLSKFKIKKSENEN